MRAWIPIFLALLSSLALADPCGMVPPIQSVDGPGPAISRIGKQQTYVFYRDGIETIALRPGFSGRVDDFGMLIPFPTAPAIRKIPDATFEHLVAAVDPPPVIIDLRPHPAMYESGAPTRKAEGSGGLMLDRDEVRVLREEAVGMYQVAVLEAGSAGALSRWMKEHGYRYPDGMDSVCDEYVAARWCFVTVKTRVGDKSAADPRPGMRRVEPGKTPGRPFDGYVQGMGFRFPSKELVVPMRLSAFNAGELNNVVYLLADQPMKIKGLPDSFVKRQLPGVEVFRNLTEPLPLEILGGTIEDLSAAQRAQLPTQRNPDPKNGIARELFASDLLAVGQDALLHDFEKKEKALLEIGERLNMRGPEINELNEQYLSKRRQTALKPVLAKVKQMTLTVIEGEFPRDLLARDNIRFEPYAMPDSANRPVQEGLALAVLALLGGLWAGRRRLTLAGLLLATSLTVWAAAPSVNALLAALADPERASSAADQLIQRRQESTASLLKLAAAQGADLSQRGFAIACLARIGGTQVDTRLQRLHRDQSEPLLLRTWAAAARIEASSSLDQTLEHSQLVTMFPAARRTFQQKLSQQLSARANLPTQKLVRAAANNSELSSILAGMVDRLDTGALARAMFEDQNQQVRQLAAGLLGAQANRGAEVAPVVLRLLRFNPDAKEVPWKGGPLFLPGLQWSKEHAGLLVDSMVRWLVWAEHQKLGDDVTRPLENNLRSYQLWTTLGDRTDAWRSAQGATAWLNAWAAVAGEQRKQQILNQINR